MTLIGIILSTLVNRPLINSLIQNRPILRVLVLLLQPQSQAPQPLSQINNREEWEIVRDPSGMIREIVVHRNVRINQPEERKEEFPRLIELE